MELKLYNYGAHIQGQMNDNELHFHECIQVSRSVTNCSITILHEEVHLKAGECVVIAHNVKHRIESSLWTNVLIDNECIVAEELISLLKDQSHVIIKDNKTITQLMDDPKVALTHLKSTLRDEVKEGITLIAGHDHNCDLNEIASKVSLSADHFRKIFKEEMGITFKNYLRWQKVKCAFSLISTEPKTKLVDVAHSCGFSDQAHMSKIIKEMFGYRPKMLKYNL
jgi:transcriptional regulator GlxA family with amidase domain